MEKEIEFSVYGTPQEVDSFVSGFETIDGLTCSPANPKFAFDHAIDAATMKDLVVLIVAGTTVEVVKAIAKRICYFYSKKPKEDKTVKIGKTIISGENITVNQITIILEKELQD